MAADSGENVVTNKASTIIQDDSIQEFVDYESLLDILERHLGNKVVDKPFLVKNGIKIIL